MDLRRIEQTIHDIEQKLKNKPTIFQQICRAILVLFGIFMLIMYINYISGGRYFKLNENIGNNDWLFANIINCIFFTVNMFFAFSISLSIYDKRILKILVGYAPIYIIGELLLTHGIITSALLPLAYIICWALYLKQIRRSLIDFATFAFITGAYQFFAITIKINTFRLDYNEVSIYQIIFYSIDLFIFYMLYYCIGGDSIVQRIIRHLDRLVPVLGKRQIDAEPSDAEEEIAQYNSLTSREQLRTIIVLLAVQLLQLFVVMVICLIGNKLIEIVLLLPTFWAIRSILKKSYHDKVIVCTIISAIIFYAGSAITMPAKLSIFMPMLTGALIAIALHMVSIHIDRYHALKRPPFVLQTASEEQLRTHCRVLNLSGEYTDRAVDYFINQLTNEEIATKYFISVDSAKRIKTSLKHKLTH